MRSVNRNDCVMRTSSCDVLEERESRNPFLFSLNQVPFIQKQLFTSRKNLSNFNFHFSDWTRILFGCQRVVWTTFRARIIEKDIFW